ncbi:hypothetical protein Vafri_7080 [Volvox africanus]|uniref:Uncharacterized protein n=1 Tax=Volvox africanus TaxID=51714 RepID=A0A8J4B3S0_9CHLO|nr:hypothetical protein Vafri_7080 [Volvox africanus]
MLTLRTAQPQRPTGTSGRSARKGSENATRVPTSKKCKLDIKRKHLHAAIPGCLGADSYAVDLQLQIDGETLPEVYKCTIKKHINNKTNCVSYRLQGSGIYNHLRGLYMRGFSRGEEKGVVVLVASSEAAMDLSYRGQSDVEEAGSTDKACIVSSEPSDSEAEKRQQRRRRQLQQRSRQQRKRRREDSDEDGGENYRDVKVKVEAETAPTEPSGQHHAMYPEPGQDAAVAVHQFPQPLQQLHQDFGLPKDEPYPLAQIEHSYHDYGRQQLRSHPVHASEPSPITVCMERQGTVYASVRAHALSDPSDSSAALLYKPPHDDAVSTLDAACVKNEIAVCTATMPAGRRGAESGGGQGRGYILHPFDQHIPGAGAMGLMGFGRAGGRDGSNNSLMINTVDVERRTMHVGGGPGAGSSMDPFDKHSLGEEGMGLMGFGQVGGRSDGFNGLSSSAIKVERRTVQISCGPGPGSIMYPFDRHTLSEGTMGMMSFGRVGSRCDGFNGLSSSAIKVERRTVQISCGPGPGSIMYPFDRHALGEGAMGMMSFGRAGGRSDGFNGLLNVVTPGQPSYLLGPGLVGPDAGVLGMVPEATPVEQDGAALQNAALTLPSGFLQHRDNLPDLPFTSSFSPGQLQVLTGQPHLPVGSHPPLPQVASGWGPLPLDSDNLSPRQQFAWGESLGL